MSGAVLGTANQVDKFDDELKFQRDESFDFNVSVTCHTRNLLSACPHLFQKRQLGELLEQVRLIEHMWYLFKIENYDCIRITRLCILYPLALIFISWKGGLKR